MRRHFSVLANDGLVRVQARVLPGESPQQLSKVSSDPAEKIKRAVLYQELNATNRRLIFRPTKAHLLNQFDPPKHKGQVLSPTQYLGVPSKLDYDQVVSAVASAQEASELAQTFDKCITNKTTARNLKPTHISALLRKAAEFGNYEDVYHYITCRSQFAPALTAEVYLEALRIVALRVPAKSRDVKNLLFNLYKRAREDSRREAALLYGLSQYQGDASKQIEECASRIEAADLTTLDPVDAALLVQAGQQLGKRFDISDEGEETTVYTVAV